MLAAGRTNLAKYLPGTTQQWRGSQYSHCSVIDLKIVVREILYLGMTCQPPSYIQETRSLLKSRSDRQSTERSRSRPNRLYLHGRTIAYWSSRSYTFGRNENQDAAAEYRTYDAILIPGTRVPYFFYVRIVCACRLAEFYDVWNVKKYGAVGRATSWR